jgi:hypothetical protein
MSRWCVIYMLRCLVAIGVLLCHHCLWVLGMLYISAWGFGVARFDKVGNSYEPHNVERA